MIQALLAKPILMDPARLPGILSLEDTELPPFSKEPLGGRSGAVAVVQVHGVLMDHPGIWDRWCGFIGYEDVVTAVEQALDDPEVDAVLLDMDSPGGEAGGMFAAAERLRALRGKKPLVAFANSWCTSGCYGLAAACDKIYGTPAATTGSVGVILAHVEWSAMNERAGLKYTILRQGPRKADGNPNEPLSENARAELQAQVDHLYGAFVALVSQCRGIDPAAIRAQESRCYIGAQAEAVGLIDGIRSRSQLIAELGGIDSQEDPVAKPRGEDKKVETDTCGCACEGCKDCAGMTEASAESLLAAFPRASQDLLSMGARGERERVATLQAHAIPGHEPLLSQAIASGMGLADFAVAQAKAARANPGLAYLARAREDGREPLGGSIEPAAYQAPKSDDPEKQWESDPKLQAQFGKLSTYKAYLAAVARGDVRMGRQAED